MTNEKLIIVFQGREQDSFPKYFYMCQCNIFTYSCYFNIVITIQDPEEEDKEWVRKMYSDRRSSPSDAPDFTPLHVAIYEQHPGVARLLIEKSADVNKKDHFGLTPFMLCALRSKFLKLSLSLLCA